MPKPVKGQKTPGSGRKPGTPNKSSLSLLAKCEERGIDVFNLLLDMCVNAEREETRLAAMKEVGSYLYAKRKSLEHSGSLDPKIVEASEEIDQMSKEEQVELLEKTLKELKA